ncbi:unnamed protein product [Protopolystoma xenopodis]|uniref:EGF-like domain-containing protein n=1 Tax=Protopolystoma xenopodis TaxID=117903 RepID=A0A448XL43_9PLAT|nr:unnamed protein product [Protopolystoma xenopodis]
MCDPVTGRCQCPPGWQGEMCERPCSEPGFFGKHCQERYVRRGQLGCLVFDPAVANAFPKCRGIS